MSSSTLSTRGQLVIPARLRKALNLRPGDKVEMQLEGRRLVLERELPRAPELRRGNFGRPVLVAPEGAPAMTTESVSTLLGGASLTHLLDMNFLVACGWESHGEHIAASRWLSRVRSFATCPMTEMGFLRVSLSPVYGASFGDTMEVLEAITRMRAHRFLRDATRAQSLPASSRISLKLLAAQASACVLHSIQSALDGRLRIIGRTDVID
jgi:AbrB family looped-hinge helix DNA binding protein